MLSLSVPRAGEAPLPALGPDQPGVESWLDADGRLVAFAARRGDEFWIEAPGVARFRFTAGASEVVGSPASGARLALVHDYFYRVILPLALQVRGFEVLHASAVETSAGIVALAAPKESGKSTLAFALSRRGHRLWADDAVVFEPAPEGIRALRVPFDLRLRAEPAALFGRPRLVKVSRPGRARGRSSAPRASRLAAVLVLHRSPTAAPAKLERLAAGAALGAVLEHAYCFTLDDAVRKQRMVDHYLELVARVPVHRLSYGSGLEHLPAILSRIDEAVALAAPRPA